MIKTFRIVLLFSILALSASIRAQDLSIINITGNLPLNDTAFESVPSYTQINIFIFNADSLVDFTDTLDVFLRANSNPIDTLYFSNGIDSIPALGNTTLIPPGYHFSPTHFDDGDNIVVIWPAARSIPVNVDSTVTHVYFQSLTSVDDFGIEPFNIYPNPATEYIYLDGLEKMKVKRVRILDSAGKECYSGLPVSNTIQIKHLAQGTYTISIEKIDGSRRTFFLIKR